MWKNVHILLSHQQLMKIMKKLFTITLLLLYYFLSPAMAQSGSKFSVKGSVTDLAGKPMEGGTVLALDKKDSSLVTFGRVLSSGAFELRNMDKQAFILKITYVGMQSFTKLIEPASDVVDLGTIKLEPELKELNSVSVKGERAPVTIKQDTIEYNAGSFKVQPNAAVEELLKRLPGVEVDKDGTVRAQGQTVQRVTVEGKEFFGRDPKIATKNLPADAVDKVQVFDRKSDQAQFSGVDDGQREKTINLSLKEEKKNLAFGNISAGGGPDERLALKGNLNRFSKTRQFSVLGMGNNVNQQGFSINDYMSFTGMGQQMMAGGGGVRIQFNASEDSEIPLNFGGRTNGFLNNWAGGVNFNNQFANKTEINGSYFYNKVNQDIERETSQRTSLQNSSFLTDQSASQGTGNESHRLNLTADKKFNDANVLKWTNRFDYRRNDSEISSLSSSYRENGIDGARELQNEGQRKSYSAGDGIRLNSELLYRHKFSKKGRSMATTLTYGLDQSDKAGGLQAINKFYKGLSAPDKVDTLRQVNTQDNDKYTLGAKVSYTEPVGKGKYLEFNYAWQKVSNDMDRKVFDLGKGNEGQVFNPLLSNQFENDFIYQRGGANFRATEKKWNGTIGLGFQLSALNGRLILQNTDIDRTFLNALPSARFQYNVSNSRSLELSYETDVREPDMQQLSPVVDNSDPLNIYKGNPSLRPEFNNRVTLQFRDFNQLNFSSLFGFVNLTYTTNKIAQSQTIDEQLVRTYQPINVSNDLNINGNISKGFRIKAIATRFTLSTFLLYNRGLTPVNGLENVTKRIENRNTLRAEYRLGTTFDVSASARLTLNRTAYSVNSALNQKYINQNYTTEANWQLAKVFNLNSSLDYAVYNFPGSDFSQKIPLWNASVSRSFLKNNRGELKLSAVDLLNRNVVINRVAQANFVQDERIRSLGRYFLLTFTYSIRGMQGPAAGGVRIIQGG
jgi:outer membrane receptor protein involved in Fe transport